MKKLKIKEAEKWDLHNRDQESDQDEEQTTDNFFAKSN